MRDSRKVSSFYVNEQYPAECIFSKTVSIEITQKISLETVSIILHSVLLALGNPTHFP